jgi:hypothetical protein
VHEQLARCGNRHVSLLPLGSQDAGAGRAFLRRDHASRLSLSPPDTDGTGERAAT